MAMPGIQQRVVIVGAGFAGFEAARELVRLAGATTEVVVINSTDYFLYLPLMPQVAGGLIPIGACAVLMRIPPVPRSQSLTVTISRHVLPLSTRPTVVQPRCRRAEGKFSDTHACARGG
jgi:hypothetical protein